MATATAPPRTDEAMAWRAYGCWITGYHTKGDAHKGSGGEEREWLTAAVLPGIVLAQKVLALREERLGRSALPTLDALCKLALLHHDGGLHREALDLFALLRQRFLDSPVLSAHFSALLEDAKGETFDEGDCRLAGPPMRFLMCALLRGGQRTRTRWQRSSVSSWPAALWRTETPSFAAAR